MNTQHNFSPCTPWFNQFRGGERTWSTELLSGLLGMVWAAVLLLGVVVPSQAAAPKRADPVPQALKDLGRMGQKVEAAEGAAAVELKALLADIAKVRATALDCVKEAEKGLDKLKREQAILSPEQPKKDEKSKAGEEAAPKEEAAPASPEIAQQRKALASKKARLEERRVTCRLMLLRADDLDAQVDDLVQDVLTQRLLTRGPNLPEVVRQNLAVPEKWWDFTRRVARESAGWEAVGPVHLGGLAAVGLLGLILGYLVPRRLQVRAGKLKV